MNEQNYKELIKNYRDKESEREEKIDEFFIKLQKFFHNFGVHFYDDVYSEEIGRYFKTDYIVDKCKYCPKTKVRKVS